MKFVKLNTLLIAAAQPHHDTPNQAFNTSFHPASSAPDLARPDDNPYSFKRWLPLILRTRQSPLPPSSPPTTPQEAIIVSEPASSCPPLQTIPLTRAQTALLLAAAEGSIPRGEINRTFREDLTEEIIPLLESRLVFPAEGLFLRLDACSPKDGVGPLALHDVWAVVRKVVTSVRARNALFNWTNSHPAGGSGGENQGRMMELFFLPFDGRMAAEREYRVFCRPGDGRITGVSQYQWYKPWLFQRVDVEEKERVVRRVMGGAEEVRRLILTETEKRGEREDRLMLEQGFSFDLFYDEERGRCELVELNTFGVRSACGSCLFQWVEDRKVLYGEEEAEFRVAVDIEGFEVNGGRRGQR
ncbi:hypothetical protein C8A01DRAFT_46428 [Parachaetomium inaequale]|uniref:Cell division cycle protein 123 n=1 Tax=Parachaetomium inaequale TaxID=2588326 RepID=A0AAN6PGA0_9PEZI|nr:hypothetical protein C8A01DRAFT_46428 [Parachaetomium inaequale]